MVPVRNKLRNLSGKRGTGCQVFKNGIKDALFAQLKVKQIQN